MASESIKALKIKNDDINLLNGINVDSYKYAETKSFSVADLKLIGR